MKLLLIGWDAADWSLIEDLLNRGMMPRLQGLLSNAVSVELSPVRPFDSAPMWTSLVTGARALAHGVLTSRETNLAGTCIRPASRWTLTSRPIWSVLSAAGHCVQTYGWPATHPAERLKGIVVSDQFADFGDETSIHPPRLVETLRGLRLEPAEIDAASLVTLVPRAAELNLVGDQRLYVVAQFLASTASLHAAATWGLEREPWDFTAVRYDGLARLASLCNAAALGAQSGEPSEAAGLFGDLLPNAYRFFDMLLGRLLELAGPDASLIIVAARSPVPPSENPDRPAPMPWMFIGAGPAFNSSAGRATGSLCDVAPTVLALFGLPPEPDTHGRVWHPSLAPRASSNELGGGGKEPVRPSEVRRQEPTDSPEDDESVAHLLALGYAERPDEFLGLALRQLDHQRQWRLAEALMEGGRYDRAAEALEALVRSEPRSNHYRSVLAEAYFHLGQFEPCRRMILALQDDGLDTPLGRLALAALDYLQGTGNAVSNLRRAEEMGGASARLLEMMGRVYLGLRRRTDAARVLDAALELEPKLSTAHITRAITHLYTGNATSAERHARAAVELDAQSCDARYQLGLALAGQNRIDDAIDAFRSGIGLDPGGGAPAHRHLAELLDRRGDHALALHHRALVDRGCRARSRSKLDPAWFSEYLLQ